MAGHRSAALLLLLVLLVAAAQGGSQGDDRDEDSVIKECQPAVAERTQQPFAYEAWDLYFLMVGNVANEHSKLHITVTHDGHRIDSEQTEFLPSDTPYVIDAIEKQGSAVISTATTKCMLTELKMWCESPTELFMLDKTIPYVQVFLKIGENKCKNHPATLKAFNMVLAPQPRAPVFNTWLFREPLLPLPPPSIGSDGDAAAVRKANRAFFKEHLQWSGDLSDPFPVDGYVLACDRGRRMLCVPIPMVMVSDDVRSFMPQQDDRVGECVSLAKTIRDIGLEHADFFAVMDQEWRNISAVPARDCSVPVYAAVLERSGQDDQIESHVRQVLSSMGYSMFWRAKESGDELWVNPLNRVR